MFIDAGAPVHLGLLCRMLTESAKRFSDIRQAALFQEVKPHFQVQQLLELRVVPAPSLSFAEHRQRGLAEEVGILMETVDNHSLAFPNAGSPKTIPRPNGL